MGLGALGRAGANSPPEACEQGWFPRLAAAPTIVVSALRGRRSRREAGHAELIAVRHSSWGSSALVGAIALAGHFRHEARSEPRERLGGAGRSVTRARSLLLTHLAAAATLPQAARLLPALLLGVKRQPSDWGSSALVGAIAQRPTQPGIRRPQVRKVQLPSQGGSSREGVLGARGLGSSGAVAAIREARACIHRLHFPDSVLLT